MLMELLLKNYYLSLNIFNSFLCLKSTSTTILHLIINKKMTYYI